MVASRKRKVSTGAEVTPVAVKKTTATRKTQVATPVALAPAPPLSAVAARRAAAAAALAAEAPSSPVKVVEQGDESAEVDEEEVFLAVVEDSDENEQVEQPVAGPSSPPKNAKPSRYFAASAKPTKPNPAVKKQLVAKAFSPSMAVVQLPDATDSEGEDEEKVVSDEEEEEEEEDSLGDSDEEEEEDDEVPVPAAPIVHVGRRARKGKGPEQSTPGSFTSSFEPIEGVNVCRISRAILSDLEGTFDAVSASSSTSGVVISLGEDETLAIAGMVQITPLQCQISLESTVISPSSSTRHSSYRLFGPTSHPIPLLTSTISSQDVSLAKGLNKALQLPSTFTLQDGSRLRTVFLVTELDCGIEGLGRAVPGFSRLWPDGEGAFGVRGFHPIIGSFPQPVYPHTTPSTWQKALKSLPTPPSATVDGDEWDPAAEEKMEEERSKPFIGMIKGPKRSGKSTFARAMANQLLTTYERVAFLECDLGQSEFGCGGVVGLYIIDKPLLGPSFSHPTLPVRSHFIGAYSPKSSPDHYLDSIHNLLEHYRFEVQYDTSPSSSEKIYETIPLVINTQGWVKGLGMDLLRSIEQMAGPTHVFAFEATPVDDEGDARQNNPGWTRSPEFDTVALPHENPWGMPAHSEPVKHFMLSPPTPSPLLTRYSPADLRILSTMAYFASTLTPSPLWDLSRPLVAQPPWQVDANEVIRSVVLAGEGSDCIMTEDLPLALNGSIVALVSSTADLEAGSTIYAQGRSVPPPAESSCIALALIRACTPALDLQLLTPLPAGHLSQVDTLIKGELELPNCAMLDGDEDGVAGTTWESVPFLEVGPPPRGAVGMAKRRFRRNLQRKGM